MAGAGLVLGQPRCYSVAFLEQAEGTKTCRLNRLAAAGRDEFVSVGRAGCIRRLHFGAILVIFFIAGIDQESDHSAIPVRQHDPL
jgi:hypothetical protein